MGVLFARRCCARICGSAVVTSRRNVLDVCGKSQSEQKTPVDPQMEKNLGTIDAPAHLEGARCPNSSGFNESTRNNPLLFSGCADEENPINPVSPLECGLLRGAYHALYRMGVQAHWLGKARASSRNR
ncbi:hypothetical protein Krac_1544 [Ktedonobacter racemifer DSM 44963]|uniref:Uncharacterized protein n=1 Tax=Ktedonobacter racemifer DSM 44963 TaxID=485913 RepID=D6U225_KTERA|nr:hypothetical protein Krac_1544 [Ktedonobacter racemifer DSM 44963]